MQSYFVKDLGDITEEKSYALLLRQRFHGVRLGREGCVRSSFRQKTFYSVMEFVVAEKMI